MSKAPGARWTARELRVLREQYETTSPKEIAVQIGRTLTAVRQRAKALGLRKRRRWTVLDDKRLRDLWGSASVAVVARQLGRGAPATYWRARLLGLGCGAVQGHEYLTQAAKRTGFAVKTLRKILAAGGVAIRLSASRNTGSSDHTHMVDAFDVDVAVEQWLKSEPVGFAAKRLEIGADVLRYWLRRAQRHGFRVPLEPQRRYAQWRVPTEVIEAVVAWRDQHETLNEAARRTGIHCEKLSHWLLAAGVPRDAAKPWFIKRSDVDDVVALRRQRAA